MKVVYTSNHVLAIVPYGAF